MLVGEGALTPAVATAAFTARDATLSGVAVSLPATVAAGTFTARPATLTIGILIAEVFGNFTATFAPVDPYEATLIPVDQYTAVFNGG
jgi:hypothetical protein